MPDAQVERRRSPRVPLEGHALSIVTTNRVRVLEIGHGGALLACPEAPPTGATTLRLKLASIAFASDVDVLYRLCSPGSRDGVRLGAAFVGTAPACRHALEQFLAKAASGSRE